MFSIGNLHVLVAQFMSDALQLLIEAAAAVNSNPTTGISSSTPSSSSAATRAPSPPTTSHSSSSTESSSIAVASSKMSVSASPSKASKNLTSSSSAPVIKSSPVRISVDESSSEVEASDVEPTTVLPKPNTFLVERFLAKCYDVQRREAFYLTKWIGYEDLKDITWEPESQLKEDVPALVRDFNDLHGAEKFVNVDLKSATVDVKGKQKALPPRIAAQLKRTVKKEDPKIKEKADKQRKLLDEDKFGDDAQVAAAVRSAKKVAAVPLATTAALAPKQPSSPKKTSSFYDPSAPPSASQSVSAREAQKEKRHDRASVTKPATSSSSDVAASSSSVSSKRVRVATPVSGPDSEDALIFDEDLPPMPKRKPAASVDTGTRSTSATPRGASVVSNSSMSAEVAQPPRSEPVPPKRSTTTASPAPIPKSASNKTGATGQILEVRNVCQADGGSSLLYNVLRSVHGDKPVSRWEPDTIVYQDAPDKVIKFLVSRLQFPDSQYLPGSAAGK